MGRRICRVDTAVTAVIRYTATHVFGRRVSLRDRVLPESDQSYAAAIRREVVTVTAEHGLWRRNTETEPCRQCF